MFIKDIVVAPGLTGFYFDDQQAIRNGAPKDGFHYTGIPLTEGYSNIRQPGESILVMLILDDGQVAYGDCASVQYAGVAGRDKLFLANIYIPFIKEYVIPILKGTKVTTFMEMSKNIETLKINGEFLHSAIQYGLTQAFLDAVAKKNKMTMAEVIREEFGITNFYTRIPIYAQSGDSFTENVDKMILKNVDILPHGLINNVETKLGVNGGILKQNIQWVKERIKKFSLPPTYSPILQYDVYGTIGLAFKNDINKIIAYLKEIEEIAYPYRLRIESPIDMGNVADQIHMLRKIRVGLKDQMSHIEIVADEWCNTLEDIKKFVNAQAVDMIHIKTPDLGGIQNVIEAILYCKQNQIGAFCGGGCNETDITAKVTTHIAVACNADQCIAKPGMGVDEGLMIVSNEMNRILALVWRDKGTSNSNKSNRI
jgi:methylaspartate ammonia-lyase